MKFQFLNRQSKYKLLTHKTQISAALERAWELAPAAKKNGGLTGIRPDVCVSFIGPRAMRKLNRESRGVDQTTDVLSFPLHQFYEGKVNETLGAADFYPADERAATGATVGESAISDTETASTGEPAALAINLGDIVICPERAAEQAIAYGHSFERELVFLALHGMLHLIGYDHLEADEERRMRRVQSRILNDMGLLAKVSEEKKSEDSGAAADVPVKPRKARNTEAAESFRSGFVAIVGRPNAGKSTLLNQLSGEYLAITSPKAQTTRQTIRYILTTDKVQCIFIDTPGLHKPQHKLGDFMMEGLKAAVRDCDVVLLLLDETKQGLTRYEEAIAEMSAAGGKPVILAINKIDLLPKENLLPLIVKLTATVKFDVITPISALNGDGCEVLLDDIITCLPEGPLYYPPEDFTDQSERQLAAELIREKILRYTNQEIPHGTGVVINRFDEITAEDAAESSSAPTIDERVRVRIQADILCERDSHKKILIGKGGAMLKRIGSAARRDIAAMLGCPVHLELFVKVRPDWRNRKGILRELGYAGEATRQGRD